MHANPTSTRDSGDFSTRKFPGKTFNQAIKSGDSQLGKQGTGLPGGTSHKVLLTRNNHAKDKGGKEGTGKEREGKE